MNAPDDARPQIKGWCPSAHRPMLSGDGLVFRVRPFFGEITDQQALGLCDLAETFGNGMLDLTSRANLQIRGVSQEHQGDLLARLDALGLISADADVEAHRNILMPATWATGDLSHRLHEKLLETLPVLRNLPEKIGFAVDTGENACLGKGSADFRFELDEDGALLLRADGAMRGRPVTLETASRALVEMVAWFKAAGGRERGRMARLVTDRPLPDGWAEVAPRADTGSLPIGAVAEGTVIGAPFGKIPATDLRALVIASEAAHLRLVLDRKIFLPGAHVTEAAGFETAPSRLMEVHACPGAPFCPQATVSTLSLARVLAARTSRNLHVSGCAKGCAYPRPAALTLVGRGGRFDLVSNGSPWDEPSQRGIDPRQLTETNGPI